MSNAIRMIDPIKTPPISMATVYNGLVYVAGQVGFKPGTTEVAGADIKSQCRQTMANVDAVLKAAGTSKDRLIRCNVYLTQVERDFGALNECYTQWLGDHKPARSTVGVALALPQLLVEIDCIAALP